MRINFCIAAIVSLLSCSMPLRAEDVTRLADDPRVSDAVRVWMEWVEYQGAINRVPGISLGLVHDQEIVATSAFGMADPVQHKPATRDTLYSICSISKLFTSIAVLQLRDAGELRLDDPVSQHLPWFDIRDVHADDGPITIRGLLTHSAGLPRESDFAYWTEEGFPFPTRRQIRETLSIQETLYPSSRYFQYSNLGMTLAGEVVAEASGETFRQYISEHILKPLGMTNTYTEVPVDLRGSQLAVGHTERKRDGMRDVVPAFQARGIAPAAGFVSNVADLAQFAMWQFRTLDGGDDTVLRKASLQEMHRVQWTDPDWKTTWGLGFAVSREGDRTFVSHGGGCPGYVTHFRLEPKTRIGVIVLTNTIGSEAELYTSKGVELIGPAIKSALEKPDRKPTRDPNLDRYVGVYDNIWGQQAVLRWEEGLAILDLSTRDPHEDLIKLKMTSQHTFRRVRDDDESLGETVEFDVTEDGVVRRFKRHSNWADKVR